jgi:hypothetical protein
MPSSTKKWLAATGIFLLALVAVVLFVNRWVADKIETMLQEKIEAPDRLGFGSLDVHVLQGKIRMKDAAFEWRLNEQAKQLSAQVAQIEIVGLRWWPLVFSNRLTAGEIVLHEPCVSLSGLAQPDSAAVEQPQDLSQPGEVKIGRVTVRNGRFSFLEKPSDTTSYFEAGSFETSLENLSFSTDGNRPVQLGNARATLGNLHLRSKDNLYDITLRQLSFSKEDSLLQWTGFRVKPRFDKREFASQLRFKKSRLDIEFPDAVLHGWAFGGLLEGNLVARSARFDGFRLHVYEDLNLPVDSTARKWFPQESLRQAPLGIRIDTVVVNDGWIKYEELGEGKTNSGSLVFEPVEAVLTNVANDSARISRRPLMEATVTGFLMKKHRVSNRFWFDLGSPSHAFTFEGQAAGIPFSSFNPFFQRSYNLAFENGIIRQIHFKANAGQSVSAGTLDIQYEGLEFSLLHPDKEKAKFLTAIIDLLFVKEDNKPEANDYRQGEIYVRRVPYRSFYWFWWNSVQSGITTSVLSGVALKKVQKSKVPEQ